MRSGDLGARASCHRGSAPSDLAHGLELSSEFDIVRAWTEGSA